MSAKGLRFDSPPRHRFFGDSCTSSSRTALSTGLILIGIALGWMGLRFHQITQDTQTLRQAVQDTQAQIANNAENKKASELLSAQTNLSKENVKALNGVIKQLNVPWQDIFRELEKTIPPHIALLSIEPDAQRGLIRLQAEAESIDSLLQYASTLQNHRIFGHLNYSKHETNEQDPNKPARLTFELGLFTPDRLSRGHAQSTRRAFE